ncbi:hypothetical protein ACLBXM_10695 [Xanthobacteraceae bacterium A53D]
MPGNMTLNRTVGSADRPPEALLAYSRGQLARGETIRQLGLRDYAELLVMLGSANLPMPLSADHVLEEQADTFEKLWRQS